MRWLALWLALLAGPAFAQTRPITLIVPFAAGGATDAIARLVGEHMGRTLGQVVVVENVAGAGGSIGSERVANSAPDGQTILINQLALLAAPGLIPNLRFDTRTAFAPVGLVNTGPTVLSARRGLEQPLAWLRAQGERANIGHGGLGTSGHLCALQLAQALGIPVTLVTYRGGGPAMNDLVAGSIDLLCDQSTNAIPQLTAGNIQGVLVTSSARLPSIPTVPTSAEAGVPGVNLHVWHGLYVARGTPPEIINRLNAALRAAVTDPAIVARFAQLGTTPFPAADQTPERHGDLFAVELERITKLLADAGVRPGG
ncbi:tripartite tricarboxylate transporter substrate-binding protein [Sediminicoccus sp. BL-A-41-H5]|uniref:tripartite tricarboxylate transporter substrate-binding protein n=1 Tax=Sediminicoccus sp. BL-A-41-H5 TaxID=3421106 RepID=UPI003D668B1F